MTCHIYGISNDNLTVVKETVDEVITSTLLTYCDNDFDEYINLSNRHRFTSDFSKRFTKDIKAIRIRF